MACIRYKRNTLTEMKAYSNYATRQGMPNLFQRTALNFKGAVMPIT